MKVKLDFVTNSSSTSFFAYGISVSIADIRENSVLLQVMYNEYLEVSKNRQKPTKSMEQWLEEYVDGYGYELVETLRGVCNKLNLEVSRGGDGDNRIYIGINPFDMNDDETMGEFKKRVADSLAQLELMDKPEIIEEAWMDN